MLSIPEMYDFIVECVEDGNNRGAWMYIDDLLIRGIRLSAILNVIYKLSPDAYAQLMPHNVAA